MEYLEKSLDRRGWCAAIAAPLQGDIRNGREGYGSARSSASRRGIELACTEKILDEMNELAGRYRENKPKIDWLRRVLELLRKPGELR